jgi:formyltetrahydrofolate deformylase
MSRQAAARFRRLPRRPDAAISRGGSNRGKRLSDCARSCWIRYTQRLELISQPRRWETAPTLSGEAGAFSASGRVLLTPLFPHRSPFHGYEMASSVSSSFEPPRREYPDAATLLVSCSDRRGLVAALAQVLTGHGANILAADQHRNEQAGQFFQRIRFDLADLLTDRGTLERALAEVAQRFAMDLRLHYDRDEPRVAIFVSQYDHCLYDLLWRYKSGELPCSIPLIVSNRAELEPVAKSMGVPFSVIPITPENKLEQEAREIALLEEQRIDLIVLARYMQVLTPAFIERFQHRIINIHHSFLPAFAGGKPYHQAAERGVKLIGATAHYATALLDEGPIIEQDVIRTSHRDSIQDLIRKGRDVERNVLGRAVRWHLEHRVLVHQNRTVVFE